MKADEKDIGVQAGGVQVNRGTVSRPAVSFQDDEDTGFYQGEVPGEIRFASDGVETARLNTDGVRIPSLVDGRLATIETGGQIGDAVVGSGLSLAGGTLSATAAGAGHTIRENGVDQTTRTGLNFIDGDAGAGLITDDAGNDETEVNLSLYRLESQDHSHQSAGLQGGTLDHGAALTGLTDDDHTQYIRHVEAPLGQCYLSLSGGNLLLSRYNGSALFINGNHEAIPGSGPTLAATGLTANTTYFIYAFMSAGTMTLEASTTARATDSTSGHQIKSGDATRTLVGLARIITGPAWADTAAQRFVVNWFNRRNVAALNFYTADITLTTPTAFTEFSSSIRNEFLVWSEDIVLTWGAAGAFSSATDNWRIAVAYDGTTAEDFNAFPNGSSSTRHTPGFMTAKTGLAEGYHYATLVGIVPSGNLTIDIVTNSAGSRPGFMTLIRG